MKDVSDLFVWIWSLIVATAHFTYEAGKILLLIIGMLYFGSYEYMTNSATFQSVPHLGKVLISGLITVIVPIFALSFLKGALSTIVRGHMQDSGLDRIIGTSSASTSSSSTMKSATQPEMALRPYVTYDDPSVHVSRLRKGLGNSWTAEIRKGPQVKTINIGQPTLRGVFRINTFGSNGTVEWGN